LIALRNSMSIVHQKDQKSCINAHTISNLKQS
jgi:hypothetical protein